MAKLVLVRGTRAFGQASLTALALALPFEAEHPLGRLGPLQISSVELFLYLALAAWAVALAAAWLAGPGDPGAWARRLPAAHRAALVWALVLVTSAAVAVAPRAPAIKFALRSLGALLLYAAAADLLRAPAAAARTCQALLAGALGAALLTIAEAHAARAAWLWRPFHAQSFQVFGLLRASGPFQYPNIAAMYLGAALPLGLALGARAPGDDRPPGWRVCATALAALVLLDGLLQTASRTGLVSSALAVTGLGVVLARRRTHRSFVWAVLIALAVVGLGSQAGGSALSLRLRFWRDADWYRASIRPVAEKAGQLPPLGPGDEATASLEIRNIGALTWPSAGPSPVALSYHWLTSDGHLVNFEGQRTPLIADLPPGGAATLRARVRAPAEPGRYVLWWDLVHEHITWFSQRGDPGLRQEIDVRSPGALRPAAANGPATAPAAPTFVPGPIVPRAALWRAALCAWRDHPWLGLGPDNFRHHYGAYLGLGDPDPRLHANSLYFETLADLGAAGLLALAALFAALAQAARRAAGAPETRLLALGLGASLAAVALGGLFDYGLEFTPTYGLTWLLAGMLVGLGRPAVASRVHEQAVRA